MAAEQRGEHPSKGPEARLGPVVGIDLGGTNISVGVVDAAGKTLGRAKRKTKASAGRDAVIERMVECAHRACEDACIPFAAVVAIGVGAPSAIDILNGVVLRAANLGWERVPLRDLLAGATGKAVVVDNDVNVAAWGERSLGVARGRRDLIAVWVGTGLGGALVLDGQLHHGHFWTAGELGQTVLTPNGAPGARTLEEHCSKVGMTAAIRRLLPFHPDSVLHEILRERGELDANEPIGSSSIGRAYHKGDALATEVVHHAADMLGVAIANWITVLSLDTVVLGGGVTEALGKPFVSRVRRSFDRHVFPDECRRCELLLSELGDDAGIVGAAALARCGLAASHQLEYAEVSHGGGA